MKKIFIKVLTILVIISISILIINGCVQATSEEQTKPELNEILESEEKIMMYDARTNETTEVDMEQLRKELARKNSSKIKTTQDSIRLEPYIVQSERQYLFRQQFPRHVIELEEVKNTTYRPYNNVCKIKTAEGKSGSGALIGSNIFLTAAHCVFNDDNEQFKNWQMYPGFNEGNWQGTNCGWQQVYYSNKWMETHDFNYDWAICVLEKNVGDQLGYFGVAYYNSASSLNEKEIRCYGYPGTEGYSVLYFS